MARPRFSQHATGVLDHDSGCTLRSIAAHIALSVLIVDDRNVLHALLASHARRVMPELTPLK
jgi:hypothetical protein